MARSINEQLVHFLSDMYSVEQQALAQLESAPQIAGEPGLAEALRDHQVETRQQARLVGERLEAHGGSPSALKDAIMRLGGKGFLLFARLQAETPGRLLVHAYAYEAMERAGYDMLRRLAQRAGDIETAEVARAIEAEEHAMMERLAGAFDAVEQTVHGTLPAEKMAEHVSRHLAEMHAIEMQSVKLLDRGEDLAGGSALERIYADHREQTDEQIRRIERRLGALGSGPSSIRDAALKLGGLEWGLFFRAQSDTPSKLAAFAYAVEHLEIGGYEMLLRTARRAGDAGTAALAEAICAEERAMAERLAGAFEPAIEATLEAVGA